MVIPCPINKAWNRTINWAREREKTHKSDSSEEINRNTARERVRDIKYCQIKVTKIANNGIVALPFANNAAPANRVPTTL